MMRSTVLANQSCPVEAEHHRQVQDGRIVNDIVVCPLGKCAVDITERQQTVLGHSCRECHGMSFRDTHIEGAVGHLLHHDIQ